MRSPKHFPLLTAKVDSPRFIFYGGKGGVGKTTCAAARAVDEAAAGARVLVVSTDPAHSLGDALGVRLSNRPTRLRLVTAGARVGPRRTRGPAAARGRGGALHAVELDAPRAFARWLKDHRRALGDVLEHGTRLDAEDVDALLDLPMPGVDELVGILEIARLADGERGIAYDLIVVDTAPTGHTLRLLAAPETVAAVADVLDDLQREHRLIREQLARVRRPDAADRLIALLTRQARETRDRLHDPRQTAFHWVTLAEDLSLAETEDAVAALERTGMRVPEIVVNRVLRAASGPCPICDRRRADEHRVMAVIRQRLGRGRRLRIVPAALGEPKGIKALASLARDRAQGSGPRPKTRSALSPQPLRAALSVPEHASTAGLASLDAVRARSLLFFGGKGGVGKTTAAAAAALGLAGADPHRRVLLLSTDPAHSLADVLKTAVGDAAHAIPGRGHNLVVRELDAAHALDERRSQFEAALNEIASAFGADEVTRAGGGASELMGLAPPGIDELFAILSVVDARAEYDLIVVDTAPTGHALRLLEMPEAAREWTQVLLRVLLKYRSLVRPGQLAAELVDVSKSIRALQALLRDSARSAFIVVTRAAEVPRRETERLLARLRRLHLSTPAIIVNALTLSPGRCTRCRATAAAERRELSALERLPGLAARGRRSRGYVIIQTPLAAPPPRGAQALQRWVEHWIVKGAERGGGPSAPPHRAQTAWRGPGSVAARKSRSKARVTSTPSADTVH